MKIPNLNKIAKEVAKREGKKKQVNIAQIKEVISVFMKVMSENGFIFEYSPEKKI